MKPFRSKPNGKRPPALENGTALKLETLGQRSPLLLRNASFAEALALELRSEILSLCCELRANRRAWRWRR